MNTTTSSNNEISYWDLFASEYIPEVIAQNNPVPTEDLIKEAKEAYEFLKSQGYKETSRPEGLGHTIPIDLKEYEVKAAEAREQRRKEAKDKLNEIRERSKFIVSEICKCVEIKELEQEYKKFQVEFDRKKFASLCWNVYHYISSFKYVLLKPSIADAADKIDELNDIAGNTNTRLLKIVKDAILANKQDNVYEIDHIVSVVNAKKREIVPYESKFCYALTLFMRKHLPHPQRRVFNNGRGDNEPSLTEKEQNMILQAMCIVGLCKNRQSKHQYRKLIARKEKMNDGKSVDIINFGKHLIFVKHEEWSKDSFKCTLKDGDTILVGYEPVKHKNEPMMLDRYLYAQGEPLTIDWTKWVK